MQTEVGGDGNLFLLPSRRFIPIGRHFDTSYSGSAPSPLVPLREDTAGTLTPPRCGIRAVLAALVPFHFMPRQSLNQIGAHLPPTCRSSSRRPRRPS